MLAIVGLAIALTAGAILSLYVEQISAIASTVINAMTLLFVMHYRGRFVTSEPTRCSSPQACEQRPSTAHPPAGA